MSSNDPLQRTLDQLHQQLEQSGSLDEEAVAQLRETMEEIRAVLEKKAPLGELAADASLADKISETAIQFDHSHPTISGTLRRLTDLLAQMGI